MKLKTIIVLIFIIIIGYSIFSNFQQVHSFWGKLGAAFDKLPKRIRHSSNDSEYDLSDKEILKRFCCPIRGDWIVTSPFGKRKIFGKSQFHKGIDLISQGNDRVYAVWDGILIFKGRQSGYGNIAILRHSGSITTRYAHLSRFAYGISEGDKIEQHQEIGKIGNSGRATGKHLHFEIRQNDKPINPRPFF